MYFSDYIQFLLQFSVFGTLTCTESGESVEEVCWFRKIGCSRKVIANVIVFMITWGM